jgi:cytochrome c-type biogenesis protein CcsB
MRLLTTAFITTLWMASQALGTEYIEEKPNWDAWRSLPVQNGGRQKPLDTLARESLRLIGNRANFADPETGQQLNPTALWLTMMFDWQGWEHANRAHLLLLTDWTFEYFHLHQPDRWDQAPLFRVDFLELRSALGLEMERKYVSAFELSAVQIDDARTGRSIPFATWARKLLKLKSANESLTEMEERGLELANRYWSYQHLRMGRSIEVLPIRGSQAGDWMPIGALLLSNFNDASDPDRVFRDLQEKLRHVKAAYRAGDVKSLANASEEFVAAIRTVGTDLGQYPTNAKMNVEVAYNTYAPFRFAWVFMLLAFVGMLLHLGTDFRILHWGAVAAYFAALTAVVVGFAMRISIADRPPVTNMYESVIYVGSGVAIFGLLLEFLSRQKFVLTAAAAVATVALILADNCPTVLDPAVQPLQPVLRSNFWLVTHVMTIALSYAAFALAMGIATIMLGYYWVRSTNQSSIATLGRFTYKALQIGVLLLATGTILGGIWADYSWGRFWGWDPKEVWALVALLGYLAVLHARFAGWVGHRGLAALSAICFSLVIMAWYGVNFVLGAGLHSYGFGTGGTGFVLTVLGLQILFVTVALLRSRPEERTTTVGVDVTAAGKGHSMTDCHLGRAQRLAASELAHR